MQKGAKEGHYGSNLFNKKGAKEWHYGSKRGQKNAIILTQALTFSGWDITQHELSTLGHNG